MNDGSRPAMILPTNDEDRQNLSIRYKCAVDVDQDDYYDVDI